MGWALRRILDSTAGQIVICLVLGAPTGVSIALFHHRGTTIAVPVFIVCVSVVFWLCRRLRHKRNPKETSRNTLTNLPDTIAAFTYDALTKATDGFGNAVGRGGFGSVYRGTLADGTVVAVKCLPPDGDDESFQAEVTAMAALNHTNLVRLLGVCAERFHRILVYEFMQNSSLDQWIFSTPDRRQELDWKTRKSIALGAAKGLAYLHDDSRSCVLHLDIKPENILLDDKFRPKISDFGLAKTLKRDEESRLVTSRMRGTPGYMAPEWLLYNHGVTAKSDVYSFGVVLLELVCGRRFVESGGSERSWYLPCIVLLKARQGLIAETADSALKVAGSEETEEIVRLVKIALWCLHGNPASRPSMSAVVSMIQGESPVDDPPLELNIPFAPSAVASEDGSAVEVISHVP